MTPLSVPSPRDRILGAALALLERGGPSAVSTRAVSSEAGVQVPTIYRQFGDMQGLLDAVAAEGFEAYLQRKREHTPGDPVDDLRAGWDNHVAFGLAHPHLYTLMYGSSRPTETATQESGALLRGILERVAKQGRLAMSVERAATLTHAACLGLTLSLIGAPQVPESQVPESQSPKLHDPELSALTRETVLRTLLTPGADGQPADEVSPRQRAASHAVALLSLLPASDAPFTIAERSLLAEWLRRMT